MSIFHSQDQTVSQLPPPRRIAVQAGAQILTYPRHFRVNRSDAGEQGDGSPPQGAGSRGEGLGSPLAGYRAGQAL